MGATTRLLLLSTFFALLAGLLLDHRADAAPFRPRPYSEDARLDAKEECRQGGGTSFETVYHYDYGGSSPNRVTTTCRGGTKNGQTCEIGGSTLAVSCSSSASAPGATSPTDQVVVEWFEPELTTATGDDGGFVFTIATQVVAADSGIIFATDEEEEEEN